MDVLVLWTWLSYHVPPTLESLNAHSPCHLIPDQTGNSEYISQKVHKRLSHRPLMRMNTHLSIGNHLAELGCLCAWTMNIQKYKMPFPGKVAGLCEHSQVQASLNSFGGDPSYFTFCQSLTWTRSLLIGSHSVCCPSTFVQSSLDEKVLFFPPDTCQPRELLLLSVMIHSAELPLEAWIWPWFRTWCLQDQRDLKSNLCAFFKAPL